MKYLLVVLLFVSTAHAETFYVARHNLTKKIWLVWSSKPARCDYRGVKRLGYTIRKEEWRKVK